MQDDVLRRPLAWDRIPYGQAIGESRRRRVVVVVRAGTCEHASWLHESSLYLRPARVLDPRGYRLYECHARPQAALHGLAILHSGETATPPPPEPILTEAPAETTWIEIAMVDDSGAPVADEEYRIELPDGALRTGRLNRAGTARLSGIPKGTCKVSFPHLDADAWEKA